MKILISSKVLANTLNQFDLKNESIEYIVLDRNNIYFHGVFKVVKSECEIIVFTGLAKQDGRRWDWVKELLNKVDEQPIVLVISEQKIDVIFQF